jgi:hypothetical protein
LNVRKTFSTIENKGGTKAMAQGTGFFKGDKKKLKKSELERKAQKSMGSGSFYELPKVEIIKKGKKEW